MASIVGTSELDLELFVTRGLGDTSFLLASGDEAVLVDPQRDVDRFLAAAESRGASLRHVLETHVHNDYVSGALEAASRTGAQLVGSAGAGYAFPHRGLEEGDELTVGDLRIVAMATPGHTPEHLAYLVHTPGAEEPVAVFTGGSLLVGNAGRTDLLGEDRAEELARMQYESLRRISTLPATTTVLPTHGAGSFCVTAGRSGDRTSTIGAEREGNASLRATEVETFLREQLTGLMDFPTYYRHMAPINRAGPRVLGMMPRPAALSPDEGARLMEEGVWLVDGRDRADFARSHVPGSVHVELGDMFASYVGWLVPFGEPIALVVPSDGLEEAVTQLMRVGYEEIRGHLEGGMDAWEAGGRESDSYRLTDIEDLCRALGSGHPPTVLDVRQDVEHARVSLPGSIHIPIGDLPHRLDDVPRDGEVWAICATGLRSSTAASLLDREGIPVRLVTPAGVRQLMAACPEAAG